MSLAPPVARSVHGRFAEDGDWLVRQSVTPSDLQLSPEGYVARHAHLIGAFSFHFHPFADNELGAWVGHVGQLLASPEQVERCRERSLPPGELVAAR